MNAPRPVPHRIKTSPEETVANDNSAMKASPRRITNEQQRPDTVVSSITSTTGVMLASSTSDRVSVLLSTPRLLAASRPSIGSHGYPTSPSCILATVKQEDDSSSTIADSATLTDNNSVGSSEVSLLGENDASFWEGLDGDMHSRIPRHLLATVTARQHYNCSNSNGTFDYVDFSMSDLMPIPVQVLASGAPVDADDAVFAAENEAQEPELVTEEGSLRLLRKKRPRSTKTGAAGDSQDDDDDSPLPNPPKKRCMPTSTSNAHKTPHDILSTPRTSNRKVVSVLQRCFNNNSSSSSIDSTDCFRTCSDSSGTPRKIQPQPMIVGPDSHQMKMIYRIKVYLEECTEDEEDPAILTSFLRVLKTCHTRHARGDSKYLHLPGAIFEKAVEEMGGSVFARIYCNAKQFDHPRLYELDLVTFHENRDEKSAVSSNDKCMETPNLLQIAVGYGIHLAKTRFNKGDVDDANGSSNSKATGSLVAFVQEGAKFVMHMTESEREQFWKTIVDLKDDE